MLEVREISSKDVEAEGNNEWGCECFFCSYGESVNLAETTDDIDEAIAIGFTDWAVVDGLKICESCMQLFWYGYQHRDDEANANASHDDADHVKA